jgi:uncharacterized protein (DUF1697 family)
MDRYVALLRGINVGGKNIIPMASLKACFEKAGFDAVTTYIQSGNVIFSSRGAPVEARLEQLLGSTFDYRACVVVRSRRQMEAIVNKAPPGFGARPALHRCDVVYLKAPLTASAAVKSVPVREGVDDVHAGPGVLYFSRLIRRASQSRLSRLVSMPVYRSMTIRNWNTTIALGRLISG